MEPTTELTSDQIYEQAVAHYRAARWPEALAAIGELLARGESSPEVDALVEDIKFKQRLDMAQAPEATPIPEPRRVGRGVLIALLGAFVTIAVIGVGLTVTLRGPGAPVISAPPPVAQQAIGALPTPAPVAPTVAPTAVAGEGTLVVSPADGVNLALGIDNVYLILDASGSMLARVGEQRKIDLAQEALVGLVDRLPGDANVALRTYGRQRPDDCSDVELLAPLAPLDKGGLVAQIQGIEPVNLSRTPIGSSLAAVPADLGAAGGETLVVLLSDGEETCGADPTAVAAQIRAERPNVRVSVVGFDIAPEQRDRLASIAAAGGGSYYGAADMGQLAAALEDVVTPRFQVIDGAGAEVAGGQLGERLDLPSGAYTVTLGAEPTLFEQLVEIQDGMATLVAISRVDGSLSAEVRRDWNP